MVGATTTMPRTNTQNGNGQLESKLMEVPLFYRLQIDVALDEEDVNAPLHSLVAFLPADLETDTEVAPGNE